MLGGGLDGFIVVDFVRTGSAKLTKFSRTNTCNYLYMPFGPVLKIKGTYE